MEHGSSSSMGHRPKLSMFKSSLSPQKCHLISDSRLKIKNKSSALQRQQHGIQVRQRASELVTRLSGWSVHYVKKTRLCLCSKAAPKHGSMVLLGLCLTHMPPPQEPVLLLTPPNSCPHKCGNIPHPVILALSSSSEFGPRRSSLHSFSLSAHWLLAPIRFTATSPSDTPESVK